jgi:hypothetical protein
VLGVPLTPLRLTWLPATDWLSGALVAEVESLDAAPSRFRWQDATDSIEVLEPEPVRSVARRWVDRRGGKGNPLEPPWARAGWFARASAWMRSGCATLGSRSPSRHGWCIKARWVQSCGFGPTATQCS